MTRSYFYCSYFSGPATVHRQSTNNIWCGDRQRNKAAAATEVAGRAANDVGKHNSAISFFF